MGRTTLLGKLASDSKNCKWIYRFPANPGMPRGGIVPPTPVLAPGSALGSRPRVALSSGQVTSVYPAAIRSGNFLLLGQAPRLTEAVTGFGVLLDLLAFTAGPCAVVEDIHIR